MIASLLLLNFANIYKKLNATKTVDLIPQFALKYQK